MSSANGEIYLNEIRMSFVNSYKVQFDISVMISFKLFSLDIEKGHACVDLKLINNT
jgi:hypothetical protein